jgi:hypothetical protein
VNARPSGARCEPYRGADHETERLEPGLAEQHVLGYRQVRGEDAGRVGSGGIGEPAIGRLRLPR